MSNARWSTQHAPNILARKVMVRKAFDAAVSIWCQTQRIGYASQIVAAKRG